MKSVFIENVQVLNPEEGVIAKSALIRDGQIAAFDPNVDELPDDVQRFDGGGNLLTPGMIDLHTHGILGLRYDAPTSVEPGSIKVVQFGVTTVVTTLSGEPEPNLMDRLAQVANAADKARGARMDAFHFEGPFLALTGAGACVLPGDLDLLEDLLSACGGKVKAMSIAPDTENIFPVIEKLVENGVKPFITHTRANVEQTERAIDAGARHATHFYDVFHLPGEADRGVRPVGAVEAILADPRCTVDFICDGVHVHPTAIACCLRAKGYENVALITDSNSGAGLPPGIYPQGHRNGQIRVAEEGGCRTHAPGDPKHGGLAGSSLTMDQGVRNLQKWFNLPDSQVLAMATSVPARILGLENRGVMRIGADADLVLWETKEDGLHPVRTWVGGSSVWEKESSR